MSANIPARRGWMVGLGAWVILLLIGAIRTEAATANGNGWHARGGDAVGIWAFALGVIGLLKFRSVRAGLVPAVFAILIGGVLAGSMVWENWSYYARGREQAAQPAHFGRVRSEHRRAGRNKGTRSTPKLVKPIPRLAYVRVEPAMTLLVMADPAPQGQTFTDSGMVRYVRSMLGVPDSSVIAEEPYSVSGREGLRLTINSAGRDGQYHYAVWLSTRPSEAILIMLSAKTADASSLVVANEADRILKTLTLDTRRAQSRSPCRRFFSPGPESRSTPAFDPPQASR